MRIQCFVVSIFENKKIYFGNSKDSKSGNILLAHPVNYSQTSVFEYNSFWKAVQKPICSKTESYFPITNNVKEINSFHEPKE